MADKLNELLNDLIRINNDRVQGYEKAATEAKSVDIDLQGIFHKMANESRTYVAELTKRVTSLGGNPSDGSTTMGKIYRMWMDLKATFTGKSRESLLESCEFGEDAAQKAYREALESDAPLDVETRQLITRQQASLKIGHDLIKKYRDMHKVAT